MKSVLIYSKILTWCIIALFVTGIQLSAESTVSYGRPNVALKGTIISSSPAVLGDPTYVNDGLVSTLFYSYVQNSSDNNHYYCEFVLDLNQSYTIDKINLYVAQTRGFSLSISDDNVHWTEIDTREWAGSASAPLTIPLNPTVTGRYLKYYGWASWNQYVGVVEISVYEAGSVPPPSPVGFTESVNIAKDKPVTLVFGGEEEYHPATNITDGDMTTSWIVKESYTDDETGKKLYSGGVVIDLEKKTAVGKVVVTTDKYHVVTLSFPEEIPDFWGREWTFTSTPNLFATENTGSGEIVFDLKGLMSTRYITLHVQTIQVDAQQPEIDEVKVYPYHSAINAGVIMYILQ